MRIHVALAPGDFADCPLAGGAALVVDVLRATSTVVAACAAGCRRIIPVATPEAARGRAAAEPGALLAGERGGEAIPGFDLGNSPLEWSPARVGGRSVVFTTSNGTRALLAAGAARTAAVAAFTNAAAAARWAVTTGLDLSVLCAGDGEAVALEDVACAGVLVRRVLAARPAAVASEAAQAAAAVGAFYEGRLGRLAADARWARRLRAAGRDADVTACLALDTVDEVPRLAGDAVVPGRPAAVAEGAR
jgi:2-phosphosulfolactate phosphatase